MEPVQVIANPNAAGGKGARVLPELERQLRSAGIGYRVLRTESPGHACEIAGSLVREGVGDRLLVLGGDGTIHEVVNGLLAMTEGRGNPRPLPPLAILPMGTGNDFHRMVRAPGRVGDVVDLLRTGVPRYFDVGAVRWEGGAGYFVNLLGVGIDVEVLRRRPAFGRLPGLLQYLAALGSALAGFRPVPIRLDWKGSEGGTRRLETPVLLSVITVGPSIGGGFLVSPDARPDDGLLDLFLVEPLRPTRVARYLPGVLRGSLRGKPEVHQAQLRTAVLRGSEGSPFAFELDGELVEAQPRELEIRVLPGCLPILEVPVSHERERGGRDPSPGERAEAWQRRRSEG